MSFNNNYELLMIGPCAQASVNWNQNTAVFIKVIEFENVVCKMAAIFLGLSVSTCQKYENL